MPRTGPLIDEDTSLLHGNSGRPKGVKRTRAEKGVTCNRVLLGLLVVIVTALSIQYQREINHLTTQLHDSQHSIEEITHTLEEHASVIDRFNSSVTNADVITQLSDLTFSLNETSAYLESQLKSVKKEVTKQLENTVLELSSTVTKAEQEISDEVDKVKKDVEHYVVTTQDQFSMENSFMVYQLAGTFTLLSCLISMWHMTAHLRRMTQPDVQRRILAILWMSPIYAVTSWFSLVFHQAEGYLAIIKDGYEAYIIYQFLSFCIAVIGRGDREVVVDVLARHADHLTPPFRLFGCFEICGCCKPKPFPDNRALADAILLQCQGFAMQFVLFRPLTTTAMVVLKNMEYYGAGDGPTDYRSPQFYITIVQNISIFVAFTGLLKFYHAVDKELLWCRPLAKFLCIKGVVFMTFWQGLCISVLAQTTDVGGNDKTEWAMSAQNFLICLEMLLFSIAHFYCFPTEEWQEGYRIKAERGQFGDTIALGDFFQDVKLILTSGGQENRSIKSKHKRRRRKSLALLSSQSLASESNTTLSPSPRHNRTTVVVSSAGMERDEAPIVPFVDGDVEQANERGNLDPEWAEEDDDGGDDDESYETSDDDTRTLSDEDLNDDQQFVKRALNQALGAAGDDPDVAEATRRLLESKVLSPELFEGNDTIQDVDVPASLYGAFGVSRDEENDDDDDDDDSYEDDEEEESSDDHYEDAQEGHKDTKQDDSLVYTNDDPNSGEDVSGSLAKETEDSGNKNKAQSEHVPGNASSESREKSPVRTPASNHVHESKTANEEDPPKATKSGRTHEQQGMEFLTPSRMSIDNHLRPSIFTTIAKLDKEKSDQDEDD